MGWVAEENLRHSLSASRASLQLLCPALQTFLPIVKMSRRWTSRGNKGKKKECNQQVPPQPSPFITITHPQAFSHPVLSLLWHLQGGFGGESLEPVCWLPCQELEFPSPGSLSSFALVSYFLAMSQVCFCFVLF